MSEATELVVIEKADAISVFTDKSRIEKILQRIETEVRSFVPDLSTGVSRKAIASMANKVARSKTYIDGVGKDAVAELKELPKQIDEQRRIVRERLDALKDEVRMPLTQWEAEQDRIKVEEEARIAAEKLAAQIESDHEIALLLNDKFDRDAAEAKAEAERQRIAHEEEIRRQAVEQARIEAELKAQQEREAAAQREAELKAKAEQAERDRIAAEERAEREAREAQERTARLAQEAREQAERDKQAAIEAEQRKAKAAEDARLAEEKRIADEAAARAANEAHRKKIGTEVVTAFLGCTSLTREQAIEVLVALKDNQIPHTRITY